MSFHFFPFVAFSISQSMCFQTRHMPPTCINMCRGGLRDLPAPTPVWTAGLLPPLPTVHNVRDGQGRMRGRWCVERSKLPSTAAPRSRWSLVLVFPSSLVHTPPYLSSVMSPWAHLCWWHVHSQGAAHGRTLVQRVFCGPGWKKATLEQSDQVYKKG